VTATRVGELRPSQLLYTFGIGAAVDLPHISAMVLGLDDWSLERSEKLNEDRLLAAVREVLGQQVSELRLPPFLEQDPTDPLGEWSKTGVPVGAFPQWLRCPRCSYIGPISAGLFKLRPHDYRPDLVKFEHHCNPRGTQPTALPVRFLIACPRGHLDDFPWMDYAHRGAPGRGEHLLEAFERGVTGRAAEIIVRCRACGERATRSMADAFGESAEKALPRCTGRHPHLRRFEECDQRATAILLGASNAWFPITVSVVSIPMSSEPLVQKVADYWQFFEGVTSEDVLLYARSSHPELSVFGGVSDEELWEAIQGYREIIEGGLEQPLDVLGPEWEVLSDPTSAPISDNFQLRAADVPGSLEGHVEAVVLAERLREVVALVGFTRVDAPDEIGEEGDRTDTAPLTRDRPTWVPCAEVRGEGVFIRLAEQAVTDWESTVAGSEATERLQAAHRDWREARGLEVNEGWPGLRYVLLHTLSHALIREFALEAGYGASSIRERIYSRRGEQPMAGLLLYTAAPDSEGTLGGLVSLGEPENLRRMLGTALEHARLCTSDPMCAEHDCTTDGSLHGAACHACMFASETSCERGNRYLDRSLLVPTFEEAGVAFFQ
jgi:hypothetical protein